MTVLAVFVGGMIGSALRLGVDLAMPHDAGGFPYGTLLVNVAGSFALAVLVGRLWPVAAPWLRAALGAGLLGSFTTFSALAVTVVTLTAGGSALLAATYLAATLIAGTGAAALGLAVARPRRAASLPPQEDE